MGNFETKHYIFICISILVLTSYLIYLYRRGEVEKVKSRLKTMLLIIIVLITGMFVLDLFFLM